MIKMKLFIISLFFVSSFAFARVDDYIAEIQVIKNILNETIQIYKSGDNQKAKKRSIDAYFQHFENIEGPIGRNIGRKAITMERKFKNLSKMYNDKADIRKIQALIDGLIFDLDEVGPIIQNGFRLSAEKTDDGLSDEDVAKLYSQAEKERQAQTNDIFKAFGMEELDENIQSTQNNTPTKTTQNTKQNDLEFIAQLQEASAINPKLQFLLDDISFKFSQSASEYKNGNIKMAKDLLNSVLFDNYRNTKAEIVISNHTKAGLDSKIQRAIRALIIKLDKNENIDERFIRTELEKIEELIYDAFLQIPQDQIAKIQVEGFDENANNNKDYTKVANDIKIALQNVLDDYQGFSKTSIDALQGVYWDIFESSGMESIIGAIDTNMKLKIEENFTEATSLIKANASKEEIEKIFDNINILIHSMLDKIQDSSPISLFLQALTILLREGLEAMIIIVAIISYLIQSGNSKRLNIAYSALLSGIVLSFATAFLVSWIFKQNSGQSRELIEGVCILIAVGLLFYVGFWLLSNARNKKWANFIKNQTIEAISNNSAKTLWFTVFLAVYREVAETVLFYQALFFQAASSSDYSAIIGGFGLGAVILIILYFLLKIGAVKIPIKQFFYVTSYVIFYMVFVFTGKGIFELIEGGYISPTKLAMKFDSITWLGIYPYYETLIPQFIVLILLILGILITHKITKQKGVNNV